MISPLYVAGLVNMVLRCFAVKPSCLRSAIRSFQAEKYPKKVS
jgi:hypothetical protein